MSTVAAAPSAAEPRTHGQPSRKSKRAWRKNIDLTTVTTGLENARSEKIITGGKGLLIDQPSSALFLADSSGDIGLRRKARKEYGPLKAEEIIAQRSAVPAVQSRKRAADDGGKVTDGIIPPAKRNKKGAVSNAEYERLRKIAYGGDAVHKDVVEKQEAVAYDPWAIKDDSLTQPDPKLSFVDPPKPVRAPHTLKRAPVSLRADGKAQWNVTKPGAGKSYNPAFDDWANLLTREGEKEIEAEKKRLLAAYKETERLERVAKAAEEAEEKHDESSDYYESEWEGIPSDVDESQLNKKRPQRKTPAERNKINRRKEAERLAKHNERMKQRDEQVKKIKIIKEEVEAKENARKLALEKTDNTISDLIQLNAASDDHGSGDEVQVRRARFGKQAVPEAPLELVLPEELKDSLRLLKPEGNLLTERFRNMMVQGKVEPRKPISQPKKAKKKVTEKWSYKDWKLPS